MVRFGTVVLIPIFMVFTGEDFLNIIIILVSPVLHEYSSMYNVRKAFWAVTGDWIDISPTQPNPAQ